MSFDAVIIPGGGVREDGSVPEWVARRLDRALAIQPTGPLLALSGGTYHKPSPLDGSGRPVFEAYAGARYLLDRGAPASAIFTEISSYDTIGNAYFARVQHTDVRGWRRLLVVNSDFHMQRTEAIFRWLFALAPDRGYELAFETTPGDGMPAEDREARLNREFASLETFRKTADQFRSLAEVHAWMYAVHEAYRAESVSYVRGVDPHLARLY